MLLIQIYDVATLLFILSGVFLGVFALVNWLMRKVFEDCG